MLGDQAHERICAYDPGDNMSTAILLNREGTPLRAEFAVTEGPARTDIWPFGRPRAQIRAPSILEPGSMLRLVTVVRSLQAVCVRDRFRVDAVQGHERRDVVVRTVRCRLGRQFGPWG